MTNTEFSNEFDILFNSIASNQAPGLDEYEKSVFLTSAQEEVVRALYNGTLTGEPLEKTEEMRRCLDSLITEVRPEELEEHPEGLTPASKFYRLPGDVLYVIYEDVELEKAPFCEDDTWIRVEPVRHDEWHRTVKNPFRRFDLRKALRTDAGDNIAEVTAGSPVKSYRIRYLKKPLPIVLTDLDEGLSVDGVSKETQTDLTPALHRTVLKRAVQLAAASFLPKQAQQQ